MQNLTKAAAAFAPKNHRKPELNYVFLGKKHLIATDTYALLVINLLEERSDENILIDVHSISSYTADRVTFGFPSMLESAVGNYVNYPKFVMTTKVVYTCDDIFEAVSLYPYFNNATSSYIDIKKFATRFKKLQKEVKRVEVQDFANSSDAPIVLKLTFKNGLTGSLIVMPKTPIKG